MPQVLKDDMRARILDAALGVFASSGYAGATMSMIAAQAEVSTANLYRYYKSKSDLFDAVIPPALAREFDRLLARTVRALGHLAEGEDARRETRRAGDEGEELLRFWIDHRLAVVILLDRAEGTDYAAYGERFVERLLRMTLAQIRIAHPRARVSAAARHVLAQIFENTRRAIASILESSEDEQVIREGIAAFRSYQMAGLRGFVQRVTRG